MAMDNRQVVRGCLSWLAVGLTRSGPEGRVARWFAGNRRAPDELTYLFAIVRPHPGTGGWL